VKQDNFLLYKNKSYLMRQIEMIFAFYTIFSSFR